MKWKKLGRIIVPDPQIWWMSHCAGPTFVEAGDEGRIRIYMSGRSADNMSRIGVVEVSSRDMTTVLGTSAEPVLDVGETGCFDERGVAYPWIVRHGGRRMLYYVGWVVGGEGGFINAVGAATWDPDLRCFRRMSRAPVCERTDAEPIGMGSVCVLPGPDEWRMWYTSFDRWAPTTAGYRHYYCIKYGQSSDGNTWKRTGVRCIDYGDSCEYAIGKPCVVKEQNGYRMWYSYRGDAYRIGFAESDDGVHWERKDCMVGIGPSDKGWDSASVEYAHVFRVGESVFMTYNGNGFGRTGVGMAVLE